ncbi:hypothetical protein EDC04DRAFT_2663077 [Pisolithus marmoratus]|nr:hypothetical protein EDC04DRAFT_2663077 [Pisolithus marmoratus]
MSPSSSARARILVRGNNDVVSIAAVRSALIKERWKRPEEILSSVLRAAYTNACLNPPLIEEIAAGHVLCPATASRMTALHSGMPHTTALNTVHRQALLALLL